ncbi:MAG TPA: hypothetical protein PKC91_06105 [Ignavibacteria bacterium]|nr:hypothetical protein [Ignavibacteria bacterium]
MKSKKLIAEKISSVLYAVSILVFIIAFNFTDHGGGGWMRQFLPTNNKTLQTIHFLTFLPDML